MAPRKTTKVAPTAREQLLEHQLAELRGQMQALMSMGTGPKTLVMGGKPMVGIRNISSYTIGLTNTIHGEQGEIQLGPALFDKPNPNSVAIVSHQFWMTIRKDKLVKQGMLVRDDSICSDASVLGPEDRPEDEPQDAAANRVPDPFEWIASRTDDEIRRDVSVMTSEPSLRRLAAAVDHMIWKIGEERYKDHDERAKFAIRDCPSKYRFLDTIVEERLLEIDPMAKDAANEREVQANFRG